MSLKKFWHAFRVFNAQQIEHWERIRELNSPWEQQKSRKYTRPLV